MGVVSSRDVRARAYGASAYTADSVCFLTSYDAAALLRYRYIPRLGVVQAYLTVLQCSWDGWTTPSVLGLGSASVLHMGVSTYPIRLARRSASAGTESFLE